MARSLEFFMETLISKMNRPQTGTKPRHNKKAPAGLGYRDETFFHPYKFGYVMANGGMGDFIGFTRAIEWIADTCPHIMGTVFYPDFMVDFGKEIFRDRKYWSVEPEEPIFHNRALTLHEKKLWTAKPDIDYPYIAPLPSQNMQFFTPHSAHALEVGFAWYANLRDIPGGYNNYPLLDFLPKGLPKGLTPKKYAVFTPGATADARMVPGHYWNQILEHTLKKGLIPVVLGKSKVMQGYDATFSDGLDWDNVLDLRDMTTTLEAAQIMQHAAFTIGLDNGLLHLAGCTDATIIFGYNVAIPEHRRPRRDKGRTIDIYLTPDELKCAGCQSRMKALYDHDFRFCLYKDIDKTPQPKCVDLLFAGDGERWIDAIDQAIEMEQTK